MLPSRIIAANRVQLKRPTFGDSQESRNIATILHKIALPQSFPSTFPSCTDASYGAGWNRGDSVSSNRGRIIRIRAELILGVPLRGVRHRVRRRYAGSSDG